MRLHSTRRASGRTAAAGFTLLEVMIAIAVMLVSVFAAFASQVNAVNLVRSGRESIVAMADLQSAMDSALLVAPEELPVAGSDYADDASLEAFDELHLTDQRIAVDYPGYAAGGSVPDPLTVVMTCTWTDFAGRPRSLALSSMITR